MKKMLLLLFALSHSLPILLAQPTATLSLEEAIDLGLQNSKALKLSDSKRALLKIKVGQLKNALIPGIQLSSGYSRLSNNITPFTVEMAPGVYKTFNPQILNQYTNRASLNYPVFTGFKLVNSLDNIRFLEQAGELDYEKDRNEIRHQIIRSYFSLQKLMLGKQSLQESQKAAAKRLEDVRALHKQGV
ncbi:MAG TPA: TolC family protein, partial [Chitinophagaceae bacterium]|nr:TolC family protein [Chitinophagaceae bacterium]